MNKKRILYCLLISTIFLLICTKTSPLYKINDWYDASAFFTMGKSMMAGKVPYLDLFEQKGPLLYLIYGIASLISNNTYIGVFLIEVIFNSIFLYYASKIVDIYLPKKTNYILLPIISAMIFSSRSFTHGGSCEELAFPFIIIPLYYLFKYLKTNEITNKETLLIGITAGCLFWLKYTLLGLHVGFCLIIFLKKIINKEYKDLLYKILFFILGLIITSIPWLIYFIINNGLGKLIDTYFLFNMTSYADKLSLFQKLIKSIYTIKGVLFRYYQYFLLILLPVMLSIKTKTFFNKRMNNFYLLMCCSSLLFFLFIGGTNFRYYSLPMQPLMILGLIYVTKIILETVEIKRYFLIALITIPVCLIIAYEHSPNTKYLEKEKNNYAQFVFADIIEKDATILNYGFLDGGFYFTTKTIPNTYYFQKNNINYELYPHNIDEQRKYVKEKRVDYVITIDYLSSVDRDIIEENYHLLMTHKQSYEEKDPTYYLYKKNN